MIESSSNNNNKKSRRTRPLRTDFFFVGSRNLSTIMGQFKCITVKTNSLNYSLHVPAFIMLTSKTSIFHKILYN